MGSTSYITDAAGEVYQHLEYFAFGETFVEEHSNIDRTPYLFNGKELDEETGLNYYGARYYDAQTSVWLSVDPMSDKYQGLSPYQYAGNNPITYVDYDGNDYGIKVDRKNKFIIIRAHFITSSQNAGAFNKYGRDKWNKQSGKYVFVSGGVKALKAGKAEVFNIKINVTSEIVDGETIPSNTPRDQKASSDKTGIVNSFDTVKKFPLDKNQNGGTSNNQVDVKKNRVNSGTTTHETSHAMGNAHTDEGGFLDAHGGSSVGQSNISETLQGVGIGGDTSQRNTNSKTGDGTLLNGSTNQGLTSGKVISTKRYNRIMRRTQKNQGL